MVTAGPSRSASGALVLTGCLLVVLALVTDAPGRVLVLPAAALLLAFGARNLVLHPALRADAHGVEVVAGVRRLRAAWPDVERLRVVTDRRTPVLELDLGDALVVLSRLRLGRPPGDVLAELLAARTAG